MKTLIFLSLSTILCSCGVQMGAKFEVDYDGVLICNKEPKLYN